MAEPVNYRFGFDGPNVRISTSTAQVEIIGLVPAAQAREFAAVLLELADRVEQNEGITGVARRDAFAKIDTQYALPAQGRPHHA